MMEIDEVSETLGRHGAQLESIDEKLGRISVTMEQLVTEKHERAGGRKAFYGIAATLGTLAGAAGSAIAAYLHK